MDLVRDGGSLIENVEGCRGSGMLAGEGFGIVLFARLRRAEPRLFELLVIHALARRFKPVTCNAALRPCLKRRPGARAELLKRVGRDGPLCMRPRGHDP